MVTADGNDRELESQRRFTSGPKISAKELGMHFGTRCSFLSQQKRGHGDRLIYLRDQYIRTVLALNPISVLGEFEADIADTCT